jgi:hypothetical protein
MKMKYILQYLIIILISIGCIHQEEKQSKLDIRINYNANLFHFVDYLSQWSEYTGSDALNFYKQHFELSEQDNKQLIKYSSIREKLGWEEEINLFNWAYDGFVIRETTRKEYVELKSVIEYFSKRENEENNLEQILKDEFSKLLSYKQQIKQYSLKLEETFSEIDNYLTIWTPKVNFSKYPIYLCFSHSDNSTHGGANGAGVFSEIMVNDKKDGIRIGFSTITHEITHKATDIMNFLIEFIENSNTKEANDFLKQNNLTKNELSKIFSSTDTLGFGNPEAKVFEEINVYFIAPVTIDNMTVKQINDKIVLYKNRNKREFERVWYGVQLFKKEYDKIENSDFDKKSFIWKLIEIYYNKVYFENYKSIDNTEHQPITKAHT